MSFVSNYFTFILPNMFIAGTIIFGLASKWQNTIISFVGSLIILLGYIVSISLASDIENETVSALIDTFGLRTYNIQTKYYTVIEKNIVNPSFIGLLLFNRAIWIAFGMLILLLSYFSFSFIKKDKKIKEKKTKAPVTTPHFLLPKLHLQYGTPTQWKHFKSFFFINFLSITKNITFKILFLFGAIILITSLLTGYEYYGLQTYPLTYKIIDTINQDPAFFILIILVFFSGELIWRDRDFKINEVIDASPHLSVISLIAKTLSLVAVATALRLFYI
ncbi:hypothetical protein [Aquimarina agarivorans]|uniref:hypothetical protein n=1 Tax=Aquimarina agarivorans TaxID=980584 RepID=UPI0002F090D9|nr:hypothetical protein [Aquimarina agarivorans]